MQATDHAVAKMQVGRAMLQGDSWREAVQAAGVQMSRATAYRLRQRMLEGEEAARHDRRQGRAVKVCGAVRTWLEAYYQHHPCAPGKAVQALLEEQYSVRVSVTHLNRLRAALTRATRGGKKQPGTWQDGAGGLLLLAAAQETDLLSEEGAIFISESLCLSLASSVPLEEDGQGGVRATFTLHQGQSAHFQLESAHDQDIRPHDHSPSYYENTFLETKRYWQTWLSRCQYQGRWREMVHRSALVLKLLTYAPTGAIVAAPTTSLPETIGGTRNWDYRYTWLRDAAFTLYGLLILGFTQAAEAFMGWLEARCQELGPNGSLQPMFTIDGGHDLTEITLDHLEGYRQSGPVRIGNGAYKQQQLDVYGELLDSIYLFGRHKDISYDLWWNLRRLLDWLSQHWQDTDEGIWEVRGGQRHFVHSRVMSWVAFDRALRIARHRGLPAPRAEWEKISSQIYEEIMEKGWNEKVGSFVQYYGSEAVDASALLMSLTRFTGPDDPRMVRTIDRIHKELTSDSHVYRYNPELAADDGFGGQEGTFSICSFWLVEALARAGRLEEGRLVLEKMLTYANHVGLYAEEVGATGEALGNFPQAFTHLSLISACYNMDRALNGRLRG